MRKSLTTALVTGLSIGLIGCGGEQGGKAGGTASGKKLSGEVNIDGSSTVAPITKAAAEMFYDEVEGADAVEITVGVSGTGGGFKKFADPDPNLRTDISDASRPVKDKEIAALKEVGVEFVEIPIALDGIAVVVNKSVDFTDHLTVEELKKMWAPESQINNWSQVRQGFPDLELKLYGPGADSGTFDYWTEEIVGESKKSRSDYTMSEDDNMLVQGVEGSKGALGYFGYAYYEANKDRLKLVAIDSGDGKPVKPRLDTISSGIYKPLSRPLFLYVNIASLEKPAVKSFLDFILDNAKTIVQHPSVGYVALDDAVYEVARDRLKAKVPGSAIASAAPGPIDFVELYKAN